MAGCLLPLALDVRKFGDDDDIALQTFIVVITIASAGLYFLLERLSPDIGARRRSLATAAGAWWLYLMMSPLPVIIWQVDVAHFAKVLLPYVLFGVGLTVMLGVARRRVDPAAALDVLFWGALISTVWRAVYAVGVADVPLDEMRWQILGPAVPFLLGYGSAGLYLGKRRRMASVALVTALVCIGLSVTRSYLISGLLIGGGLLLVDVRRNPRRWASRFMATFVPAFIGLVLIGVTIASFVRPDVGDIWYARLFEHTSDSGLDLTLVTRLAEYRGQLDGLTQSAWTVLFGNGIGADYFWDLALLSTLPFSVDSSARWFAGHSTWVYPFFASGVVLGMIVPLVLLYGLFRAYQAATVSSKSGGYPESVIAFTVYLAYIGQSVTANVFSERYAGLILGVVVGAALIYFRSEASQSHPERQRQRAVRR